MHPSRRRKSTTANRGSLRKQLIGRWNVVSMEALNGDAVEYPMGRNVTGVITYDHTGHVDVQIMRGDRPRFASGDVDGGTLAELSAAVSGYTAYFGTYSVDESAGVVTHHVAGSLFPNWVGTEQRREISIHGDQLRLTSPPILFNGQLRVFRVSWKREE